MDEFWHVLNVLHHADRRHYVGGRCRTLSPTSGRRVLQGFDSQLRCELHLHSLHAGFDEAAI